MGKKIVYTFLAGIGIGLILSSSIHIIYNTQDRPKTIVEQKKQDQFSKEEILKQEEEKMKQEKIKEEKENEELQKKEDQEEDYITIRIEENTTSEEIANILYENNLIEHKEDFQLLLDLKRLDPFKAGDVLTKNGIISGGWKINQLLGILSKKSSDVSSAIYQNKVLENQKSVSFLVNTLHHTKKLVPGDKTIQRGASIVEIIDILTK
ncbi:hypothetical protein [Anaerophilus nitritogenes]|uniref:hypothetical protein n=1 Tax=Anaerophilus nitritogenes TaxID=2498136 RepID=UPI00101CFC67|nr:hypothetical protein [Anaerophilus nitritogenes]